MFCRCSQQASAALMTAGVLVLGVAGCSSNDRTSNDAASPSQSSPTSSPATVSTGVFGNTQSAACDTDLTLMETAVESYLVLNGGTEVTEAGLVEQGVVREPSTLHDIGPNATVVPSPTGGCAS